MNLNPVQKLMADVGSGRVTLDAAAEQLPGLLVPRRIRRPATTPAQMWEREHSGDMPPHTPGSWDDVEAAYFCDDLTDEEYEELQRRVKAPAPILID